MSAIWMRCTACGQVFITGVVGTWVWPEHVCPDGQRAAPAEDYDYLKNLADVLKERGDIRDE